MNASQKKLKRFYLARYTDVNPDSKTYMKEVVRAVTSEGWTLDGFRVDRWADVYAASMKEAREKFERGDCSWN